MREKFADTRGEDRSVICSISTTYELWPLRLNCT